MKPHIFFYFIVLIFFCNTPTLLSQNHSDLTKIIPGKLYKIVLFDDTEIYGTVISCDSANVNIKNQDNITMIIPKGNILYYSTESAPAKYKFSCSVMGGISLLTERSNYYNDYNGNKKIAPSFSVSGMFFLSDTKAVKIDAGYTYVKANYDYYNNYYGAPSYPVTYTGGDVSLYSIKGNLLYGSFDANEKLILYASVGLGIHLTSQKAAYIYYWQSYYPDSAAKQYTDYHASQSYFNAMLSIGGGLGYRFSRNFGVKAEVEYNMITTSYAFFLFNGPNYFPVRAGIFYIF
jgi:hypothetical protein